jgi:hypothetical protein
MHEAHPRKDTKMKARSLFLPLLALSLAAGAGACSSDGPKQHADESTGKTDQSLIAATGTIMAWPVGPIAWDGLVGTWPIAIWSPASIGALAFDIAGVTNLGVSCVGLPAVAPVVITSPCLGAFGFPVATPMMAAATPFFGPAGLYAPAYGYTGAYAPYVDGVGYGFGAFAPWGAYQATWLNGGMMPGWSTWLNPALTSSALMFSNLAALNAASFYTFNVTFTAASTAQMAAFSNAALSIFATPIATSAFVAGTAVPFMSMAYPIMMPIMPLAPAVVAPVTAAAVL